MPPYSTINLHPDTHSISALTTDTYDVICIGSGWAGRLIAAQTVKAGLSALIVESELIGGDCPFWACVPSKVLLRAESALQDANAVGGAQERLTAPTSVRSDAVFARRDAFVSRWDDQERLVPLVDSSGAKLVRGAGKIIGERRVLVTNVEGQSKELKASNAVVLCTGSFPILPPTAGLKEVNPWTPREATSASEVPKSLLILGGGAVACEMATAYAGFGSQITLVTRGSSLLPKLEVKAGEIVQLALKSKGVRVLLSTSVTKVNRDNNDLVNATTSSNEVIQAKEILVAIGRTPQTRNLGLENFGIDTDGRPVPVDESLCVSSVPGNWLYAAGDVNARQPLTHGSKYHARIVSNAILAQKNGQQPSGKPWESTSATADRLALPQVVFTSPPVASVGLTKAQAEKQGLKCRTVETISKTLASMINRDGAADGWAQWVLEEPSGRLIGTTLVGDDAGELLHAYTVAIVGQVTLKQLFHAVPSFPTMSEVHLNLLEAAGAYEPGL